MTLTFDLDINSQQNEEETIIDSLCYSCFYFY